MTHNPHRVLITLTPELVAKARVFGEEFVTWLNTAGRTSGTRALTGIWGAENNPQRQGMAKAGEIAVALYFDLDPLKVIKFDATRCDQGSDVMVWSSLLIDVKSSEHYKRWMLWNMTVNHLYWEKKFTVIVGVSVCAEDWLYCWIEGWIGKQDFFDKKHVADGVNDEGKLTRGTWFVDKSILQSITLLRPVTARAGFVGYDADGRFIHNCHCGVEGPFSVGMMSLRRGSLGKWYCRKHWDELRQPTEKTDGGDPARGDSQAHGIEARQQAQSGTGDHRRAAEPARENEGHAVGGDVVPVAADRGLRDGARPLGEADRAVRRGNAAVGGSKPQSRGGAQGQLGFDF